MIQDDKDKTKDKGQDPRYDSGYKIRFSNPEEFLHFLRKYAKAEWAAGLCPEDIILCDKEFVLEDYRKLYHAVPAAHVYFRPDAENLPGGGQSRPGEERVPPAGCGAHSILQRERPLECPPCVSGITRKGQGYLGTMYWILLITSST